MLSRNRNETGELMAVACGDLFCVFGRGENNRKKGRLYSCAVRIKGLLFGVMKNKSHTSFEEYCEDYLDLSVALMSSAERAYHREGYASWMAPEKSAPKTPKHADAGLSVDALKAKLLRLVASQKRAIESIPAHNLDIPKCFIAAAETALAGKAKKSQLLDLITDNSNVSRFLNTIPKN